MSAHTDPIELPDGVYECVDDSPGGLEHKIQSAIDCAKAREREVVLVFNGTSAQVFPHDGWEDVYRRWRDHRDKYQAERAG